MTFGYITFFKKKSHPSFETEIVIDGHAVLS